MGLETNISVSDTNLVERIDFMLIEGYPLKKKQLKKWIYDHDNTQSFVARKLGLDNAEFKRKLLEGEKFDKEQIKTLVYLLGAEEAFKVIYFPTVQFRNDVWWEVFGKYRRKEVLNE